MPFGDRSGDTSPAWAGLAGRTPRHDEPVALAEALEVGPDHVLDPVGASGVLGGRPQLPVRRRRA
jgi:hypothetical protein